LKKIKATAATRDLATSDHGYIILLTLLDSIDDTVLIKKVKTDISDNFKITFMKLIEFFYTKYNYYVVSDNPS